MRSGPIRRSILVCGCLGLGCYSPDDGGQDTDASTTGGGTHGGTTATSEDSVADSTATSGTTTDASASTTGPSTGSSSSAGSSTGAEPGCGNGTVDPGDVCFSAPMTIMVGPTPTGVAVEKIDDDAFDDFAVSMSTGTLRTFLGDGTGVFAQMTLDDPDPLGWGQLDLGAIADSNVDAVVGEPGNLNIIRFRGFGDGSYSNGMDVGATGGMVELIDLDGDDILDLASTTEFGVRIYAGLMDESFSTVGTYSADGPPEKFVFADFDDDALLDLVATTSTDTVGYLRGNGDGTFGTATMLTIVGNGDALAAGDFDGDQKMDFAASSAEDLGIHYGNGDGTFATPVEHAAPGKIGAMIATDLDADGIDDLLCATDSQQLAVYLGSSGQVMGNPVPVDTAVSAGEMDIADFDDDGATDVVITDAGGLNVAIVLSNP